ncbi:hypothetical protein SAMN04488057_10343 [Cyclobacterium lianum]|uniref:Uncharacterized protein n=1 Tax=Cyclobacterium lianum TaxID=388280 RepID=A0A1M7KZL2_9BACT|nr:hypothetical protein SAMN04488057_10343 [Cyclobacterium lianum]
MVIQKITSHIPQLFFALVLISGLSYPYVAQQTQKPASHGKHQMATLQKDVDSETETLASGKSREEAMPELF